MFRSLAVGIAQGQMLSTSVSGPEGLLGGGVTHTETQRGRLWTACGQRRVDSTNSQTTPTTTSNPQYANYWAPLTCKRHIPPHPAQPQHTNYWAPRTRKRHQQEHRPQRPTERSDPTQHAKGRTGDCPGPRKGTTTRRNVTQGGSGPPPPLNNGEGYPQSTAGRHVEPPQTRAPPPPLGLRACVWRPDFCFVPFKMWRAEGLEPHCDAPSWRGIGKGRTFEAPWDV